MNRTRFKVILAFMIAGSQAYADAPMLQTDGPVIHLADNLDEKDKLGWCIDTLGRGFSDRLHAHSCKPQGGDVQFAFEESTGLIRSFEYPEFCLAHEPNDQTTFALTTCDPSSAEQTYIYDQIGQTFTLSNDQDLCVSVGQASASAGPFLSRKLLLTQCHQTANELKEWVILQ